MAQVAIFKEIFDQVRKDLNCELFYSELKRHNVSRYDLAWKDLCSVLNALSK